MWNDYLPRCTQADFDEYRRERAASLPLRRITVSWARTKKFAPPLELFSGLTILMVAAEKAAGVPIGPRT